MGWGIEVNGLWLNRVTPPELETKLSENNDMIDHYKAVLIAIGAYTSPVVSDGDESVGLIDYVIREIPEIMESLADLYCENMLINKLLEDAKDNAGQTSAE